jgi:hypothetical protein
MVKGDIIMKIAIATVAILCLICCGQPHPQETKQVNADAFLGIWDAFGEGDPPDLLLKEESSKCTILLDGSNRIIVFIALRNADKQTRYLYGVARLDGDNLKFTDQHGLPTKIGFGWDSNKGDFLYIAPDEPGGSEVTYGGFSKVAVAE